MRTVRRVEKHIVRKTSKEWKVIDNIAFLSKNLYNAAMYVFRQSFINDNKIPSAYDLIQSFSMTNQVDYRALPAQTAQQIIIQVEKTWKSFFRSIKDYKKNPQKYKGRPRLPKYKKKQKGRNIIVFTSQQIRIKNDKLHFPKKSNLKPIKHQNSNIKLVRIVPKSYCYVIEVIYEKEIKDEYIDNSKRALSIDLGVNNLAACVNTVTGESFLLNGKPVKSVNQFYNKMKSKGQSVKANTDKLGFIRDMKITDYLHKVSKWVVDYCKRNRLFRIIIGKNKDWKQNINIGKRNNQKFVMIPFDKFIKMLEYKAEESGIQIFLVEESYTSKCDSLAKETIERHVSYVGKRKKRGLFQSFVGKLINADINGALNIARKVLGDSFLRKIIDSGLVFNPTKITSFSKI